LLLAEGSNLRKHGVKVVVQASEPTDGFGVVGEPRRTLVSAGFQFGPAVFEMSGCLVEPERAAGTTEVVPDLLSYQSGRRDLNPRPQRPERSPGGFQRCRWRRRSDLNILVRGTFSIAASDRQ
jgi:hypothetical protein